MKVICDGLDLSDAVLKVSKALSVKSANPVLEGIKISAEGESLKLVATDTELTICKTIKADVLMEGETVVVGKYFVEFVKKLEKEQVELSRLYDAPLQIKYSDNESELSVFPASNFPKIEEEDNNTSFVLSQGDFKKIVDRCAVSCSTDDSRPILKGCLFEVEDNILTAVALDGFRMSVVKKQVSAESNFKAVIPSRTLVEVSRLLDKDDENVKIQVSRSALKVEVDNTVIYSRLIEGEFVKYNHILPTKFDNSVIVNKESLQNSLERAFIVAKNDRYHVTKFDIKEDVLTISAKSEVGNVNENVNVNLEGKDLSIAFNGKYILDYLKTVNDEFIKINLNSPIDPCVLTAMGDQGFVYLVLPVRING